MNISVIHLCAEENLSEEEKKCVHTSSGIRWDAFSIAEKVEKFFKWSKKCKLEWKMELEIDIFIKSRGAALFNRYELADTNQKER